MAHGPAAPAGPGSSSGSSAVAYTVDALPDPLCGLADDSSHLGDYLSTITGPIILVGHSYGGAVITNAATGDPNVKALVYVDAFTSAQGESLLQLVAAQPRVLPRHAGPRLDQSRTGLAAGGMTGPGRCGPGGPSW